MRVSLVPYQCEQPHDFFRHSPLLGLAIREEVDPLRLILHLLRKLPLPLLSSRMPFATGPVNDAATGRLTLGGRLNIADIKGTWTS